MPVSRSAYAVFGALFLLQAAMPAALAQNVVHGRVLAQEFCGRCHAVTHTDRSRHPKAPPFRRIVLRYPVEQMEEALAEGITVGHADMPEFELTPRQIDDLLAHLKRLRRP